MSRALARRLAIIAVSNAAVFALAVAPSDASLSRTDVPYLSPSASGEQHAPAVSQVNGPSQCYQQSMNPHKSGHFGWMSGEVRATCRNQVPHMWHEAQLWENRWWGGEKIGTPDTFDDHNVQKGSANAHSDCVANDPIWVTGNGYIVDTDGHTYYSGTEGNHITNPCNLVGSP
jgi:hypothetical protein